MRPVEVTSSYEPSSHTVPVSGGGPPAPTQGCLGEPGDPQLQKPYVRPSGRDGDTMGTLEVRQEPRHKGS